MSNNQEEPLGGFFKYLGGLAGAGLALAIGSDMTAGPVTLMAFIFGAIGGLIGAAVEHIVARVLIILLLLIVFMARSYVFQTIRDVIFGG